MIVSIKKYIYKKKRFTQVGWQELDESNRGSTKFAKISRDLLICNMLMMLNLYQTQPSLVLKTEVT